MVNANDVKSTRSGPPDRCSLGKAAKLEGWSIAPQKRPQGSVSK